MTLELWSDPATDAERSCCSPRAVLGARELAHRMGIPHVTLDLRERFRSAVVDDFLDGYAAGRTPNPCVRCNGEVRFDAMLALADALGAARLATGHYARIARDEHGPLLRAGADPRKDQSYMLARLEPAQLERLSLPARRARRRTRCARSRAPPASRWPTGARARTSASRPAWAAGASCAATARPGCAGPGRIVDADGRELGRHDGQHGFTVGQRRGHRRGRRRAALRARQGRRAPPRVTVGPREALAVTPREARAPALHRGAAGVEAARLRYGSAPRSPAGRPRRRTARSSSSWRARPRRWRPGSWPA